MATKLTFTPTDETGGTSLQGYVTCSYNHIKSKLGEPQYEDGDDKVTTEWDIECNGKVFTIYDWKEYRNPPKGDTIYEWHIGGKDKSVLELVARLLVTEVQIA